MYGSPRNRSSVDVIDMGRKPGQLVYEYLQHVSGPTGSDDANMNVVGSVGDPGIFEIDFKVDWLLSRINMGVFDGNPTSAKFGGIAELANGVLIQAVDANGDVLQDFTGGRPLTQKADFNYLTGVDTIIETGAGLDFVRIRFTIFHAGDDMLLIPGHKLRFTIQDDLSAITEFRAMGQGIVV